MQGDNLSVISIGLMVISALVGIYAPKYCHCEFLDNQNNMV